MHSSTVTIQGVRVAIHSLFTTTSSSVSHNQLFFIFVPDITSKLEHFHVAASNGSFPHFRRPLRDILQVTPSWEFWPHSTFVTLLPQYSTSWGCSSFTIRPLNLRYSTPWALAIFLHLSLSAPFLHGHFMVIFHCGYRAPSSPLSPTL